MENTNIQTMVEAIKVVAIVAMVAILAINGFKEISFGDFIIKYYPDAYFIS